MNDDKESSDSRLAVFICHCGENIAGKVDVEAVAEYAKGLPNVVHAEDYMFMCSKQGIELVSEAVKKYNLTGSVVASCSHEQHWKTFAEAVEAEGKTLCRFILFMQSIIKLTVSLITALL